MKYKSNKIVLYGDRLCKMKSKIIKIWISTVIATSTLIYIFWLMFLIHEKNN